MTATTERMPHPCAGLSKRAHEVFEQIAIGNDGYHHPKVLKSLEKAGLIYRYEQEAESGFPGVPMVIYRYFVPTEIHIAWCAWCGENAPEETADD